MPLFQIANDSLASIAQSDLDSEKRLQALVEKSLGETFNCRFVASEFSTGATHAGRIDTLALSEDNNPVIIEYKKVEASDLINQSLFYLSWLKDHHGDFEILARRVVENASVDWSDIRVICLAPNYTKYDLHAVSVMGANIELWKYRLFANSCLYLEEVYRKAIRTAPGSSVETTKDPVMVAAGKKAAITRLTASYTVDEHLEGKPLHVRELAQKIREFITGLDTAIEEVPKKYYIAYKITQNIACMWVGNKEIGLYLKLDPKEIVPAMDIVRDVSNLGHVGTGDTEVSIESEEAFEAAKRLIQKAYRQVGG
jgi:predicted transport protein